MLPENESGESVPRKIPSGSLPESTMGLPEPGGVLSRATGPPDLGLPQPGLLSRGYGHQQILSCCQRVGFIACPESIFIPLPSGGGGRFSHPPALPSLQSVPSQGLLCFPGLPQGQCNGLAAVLLPCLSRAACYPSEVPATTAANKPSDEGPGLTFGCEWLLAKMSCSLADASGAGAGQRWGEASAEPGVHFPPLFFHNRNTAGMEQEALYSDKSPDGKKGHWDAARTPMGCRGAYQRGAQPSDQSAPNDVFDVNSGTHTNWPLTGSICGQRYCAQLSVCEH